MNSRIRLLASTALILAPGHVLCMPNIGDAETIIAIGIDDNTNDQYLLRMTSHIADDIFGIDRSILQPFEGAETLTASGLAIIENLKATGDAIGRHITEDQFKAAFNFDETTVFSAEEIDADGLQTLVNVIGTEGGALLVTAAGPNATIIDELDRIDDADTVLNVFGLDASDASAGLHAIGAGGMPMQAAAASPIV